MYRISKQKIDGRTNISIIFNYTELPPLVREFAIDTEDYANFYEIIRNYFDYAVTPKELQIIYTHRLDLRKKIQNLISEIHGDIDVCNEELTLQQLLNIHILSQDDSLSEEDAESIFNETLEETIMDDQQSFNLHNLLEEPGLVVDSIELVSGTANSNHRTYKIIW